MSIINIISNDELTLVQGVNGLFFCEESWTRKAGQSPVSERFCPKKLLGRKIKVPTSYIRRLTELNLVAKSMKRLISKSNCFPTERAACKERLAFAS